MMVMTTRGRVRKAVGGSTVERTTISAGHRREVFVGSLVLLMKGTRMRGMRKRKCHGKAKKRRCDRHGEERIVEPLVRCL